jgi:hypothetical protein
MPDIFEIIYRNSPTEGSPVVTQPSGQFTQAQGDARYARRALNLSDLNSATSARTNLGLGTGDAVVFDKVTATSRLVIPSYTQAQIDAEGFDAGFVNFSIIGNSDTGGLLYFFGGEWKPLLTEEVS